MVCLMAGSSLAADTANYTDLFRTRAIKCIHPTVNPEKATVEISKGPETQGDATTVRVKAFYQGLLKKDAMEADLIIRQAGSIRQMKVQLLSDTGPAHKPCALDADSDEVAWAFRDDVARAYEMMSPGRGASLA
jgi:hypothetical protein